MGIADQIQNQDRELVQREFKDIMRALVDRFTLSTLLYELSDICDEKAAEAENVKTEGLWSDTQKKVLKTATHAEMALG